jgi:2-haloacid dehalogenase
MEWFLGNVCTPAWNLEQDRGRPFAEAVGLLTRGHPQWEREIRAFDERWIETIAGEIPGSAELLARLKARKVRLYAITNFSHEKYLVAVKRFAFFAHFEGVVVSGEERLLKPDAAIYRLCLDRYRIEASRSLFVDDSLANVEGARRVGMHAVPFRDAGKLARDLARFGVFEGP